MTPSPDILGEAMRRHIHGLVRPLWRDMPEGASKRMWRRQGESHRDDLIASGIVERVERERARSATPTRTDPLEQP